MSISSIIEKWDTLAYTGFNIIQNFIYYGKYLKIKKYLRKNEVLRNKHKGERCFIVLNGPSLNNYDLSKISDEFVFCTNYFYQSEQVNIIKPNYYCISDNGFFHKKTKEHLEELMIKIPHSDFIFNIGYLDKFQIKDNIFLTYAKQMPNLLGVCNDLSTMSSGFISVSLFAINAAIFMGFKEIYLLGYDFEPGIFKHFYQESTYEKVAKQSQMEEQEKDNICGRYWQYSQAQYQNYYLQRLASKRGVSIFNCNAQSYVRSFSFIDFNELFNRKNTNQNIKSTVK